MTWEVTGPSKPNGAEGSRDYAIRDTATGFIVAETFQKVAKHPTGGYIEVDARANAKVVAASPELLEACRDAKHALIAVMQWGPGYDWNADALSLTLLTGKAFESLEIAIAKAEGR